MPGAWWDRDTDLEDHLVHDEDPEEHYGLFDGERRAKPAAATVAEMYGADVPIAAAPAPAPDVRPAGAPRGQLSPGWMVVIALLTAAALWLLAAGLRNRDRRAAASATIQ